MVGPNEFLPCRFLPAFYGSHIGIPPEVERRLIFLNLPLQVGNLILQVKPSLL
jgi:hypothetical protein